MVDASKAVATVRRARQTTVSTNFELQPITSSNDDKLSSDAAKTTQNCNAKDRLFKLDELRTLLSEKSPADTDKS